MRYFHAIWFVLCGLPGFLVAEIESPSDSSLWLYVLYFLSSFAGGCAVLYLVLGRLKDGTLASKPTLMLKPWDRPIGIYLFAGMTLIYIGIWGALFTLKGTLPGLPSALQFLSMGCGAVASVYASWQLKFEKFRK